MFTLCAYDATVQRMTFATAHANQSIRVGRTTDGISELPTCARRSAVGRRVAGGVFFVSAVTASPFSPRASPRPALLVLDHVRVHHRFRPTFVIQYRRPGISSLTLISPLVLVLGLRVVEACGLKQELDGIGPPSASRTF
jgi:hypothetical protein